MNFVKKVVFCSAICIAFLFSGCSSVSMIDPALLDEFNNAGPLQPEIDIDRLVSSRSTLSTYRLIPGDLLEMQIPPVLQSLTQDKQLPTETSRLHLCRVRRDGTVNIPVIGQVPATGSTLAELEEKIIDAYYPRYSKTRPSVVARIVDYEIIKTSITGAVANPGIYELRNDQKSLIALIMAAGGIVEDGAAVIRIDQPAQTSTTSDDSQPSRENSFEESDIRIAFRQNSTGNSGTLLIRKGLELIHSEKIDVTDRLARKTFIDNLGGTYSDISREYIRSSLSKLAEMLKPGSGDLSTASVAELDELLGKLLVMLEKPEVSGEKSRAIKHNIPLILPVKGLNIPFADIALTDGARIEVEALDPAVFTVVGLVKRPGAFPYPPSVKYNLMQALAFAGGVDEIADPRYVRVYRQKTDGKMVDATFALSGTSPVGAPSVTIKPGDIVAVEQTSRTRRNLLLAEVLSLRAGVSYQIFDGQDFRRTD